MEAVSVLSGWCHWMASCINPCVQRRWAILMRTMKNDARDMIIWPDCVIWAARFKFLICARQTSCQHPLPDLDIYKMYHQLQAVASKYWQIICQEWRALFSWFDKTEPEPEPEPSTRFGHDAPEEQMRVIRTQLSSICERMPRTVPARNVLSERFEEDCRHARRQRTKNYLIPIPITYCQSSLHPILFLLNPHNPLSILTPSNSVPT